MKTVWKNIGKTVLFCVILLCIMVVVSKTFEPKNDKLEKVMMDPQAKGILSERNMSLDAVVVGDSLTYTSISPIEIWRTHGIPMYVCGTSAQQMETSKQIVENILKIQKPKVILFEVNGLYRMPKLKYYLYDKLVNYFSILKYHNRWKNYSAGEKSGGLAFQDGSFKGFKINGKCRSCVTAQSDYKADENSRKPIPPYNLEKLETIRMLCEKAGIQLLLVSTPSKVNWKPGKHNAVADYAKANNLDFFDMNYGSQKVDIDWTKETLDGGDHLNFLGAQKVTKSIGKYLSEKYSLADRRADKAYESWNAAVGQYDDEIKRRITVA